ncbi:hypothetical protein D3C75_1102920 [compost metagenome]
MKLFYGKTVRCPDCHQVAGLIADLRLDDGVAGRFIRFRLKAVFLSRNRNSEAMLQGLCNMEVTMDMVQPIYRYAYRLRFQHWDDSSRIQGIFRSVLADSRKLL